MHAKPIHPSAFPATIASGLTATRQRSTWRHAAHAIYSSRVFSQRTGMVRAEEKRNKRPPFTSKSVSPLVQLHLRRPLMALSRRIPRYGRSAPLDGPIRIVTEHRSSVHHSIPVCQTSFARCSPCEVTSASAAIQAAPTPPSPKLLAFCRHATRSPNDRDQGLIGVSRRPMRW